MHVEVNSLEFRFDSETKTSSPLFHQLNLNIPTASRVLLIGRNGTGKSTLLSILAGHHLLPEKMLRFDGASPFVDLSLSAQMAWVTQNSLIELDLSVKEILEKTGIESRDPERESHWMQVLEVEPNWRLHRVSLGQKVRVILLLAMREKRKLLLLDEVTAHLDLLVRDRFFNELKSLSKKEGLSVFLATHDFDTLSQWPTHLLFLGTARKYQFVEFQSFMKQREIEESFGELILRCFLK